MVGLDSLDLLCHLSMVSRHLASSLGSLMQIVGKVLAVSRGFGAHRVLAFVNRWIGFVLRRQGLVLL